MSVMEAANNKRIKSVFLPHFVTMDNSVSTHELLLSVVYILEIVGITSRYVVDFREIADNSVNDEMTE